jgi:diadenosine tetraphosphate (Ap4A) HIT family hydrolase
MKLTDFSFLKIKEYAHWTLFLHENQCYLGRMYLLANDYEKKDFMEITITEREEFFEIGSGIKMALNHLFLPDKINYAALGNVFERLHVHFIPRYKTKRVFSGIDFIDTRWGKNYAPYEHNFEISSVSVHEIKLSLQNVLNRKI